jgi:hypothetical protein
VGGSSACSLVEQDAQGLEAVATLGLGVPVAGFLATHLGDAFCYSVQAIQSLQWLDRAEEQFGVGAER